MPFFTIQKGGNNIMDGHKPIPIHDLRKANALENKDQWLKWRKEGIGGSDSAAARGKGKFKSTLELFWEKNVQLSKGAKKLGNIIMWSIIGTLCTENVFFQNRLKSYRITIHVSASGPPIYAG